ncbi:MAG: triphosphoribosyl-dephospho-CoA synthase MdcB [Pseudomonadota bacterium]|jgi:triphosphoribosyl-dephospho-CoA synthase
MSALHRLWPAPVPGGEDGLALGRAATVALHDELSLAPKPGLVSFVDSGSHTDMDASTFLRSLFSLRRAFPAFARLGAAGAPFAALEQEGLAAEVRMLRATGGINTHRGAIFTLGLLCAAAGRLRSQGQALTPAALRDALRQGWGEALAARAQRSAGAQSNGAIAARRHGLRGAGLEAAEAFPALFEVVHPALAGALARGLTLEQARLEALFAAMATLDDTNLAHRAGLHGLRHVQRVARDFLAAGGAAAPDATGRAQALHREFVARRLSPGGAADMLAAACWLQRVCR